MCHQRSLIILTSTRGGKIQFFTDDGGYCLLSDTKTLKSNAILIARDMATSSSGRYITCRLIWYRESGVLAHFGALVSTNSCTFHVRKGMGHLAQERSEK